MGLRKKILEIVFGGFILAICIQFGLVREGSGFWYNVITGIAIYFVAQMIALIFAGSGK